MAFEIINNAIATIPPNMYILFEIGIMIILAGALAVLFKALRQPRIPAYVIAGVILGPLALGVIKSTNIILALSEIGVAFLLFFAGLEIDLKNLKRVGKNAAVVGIIEMTVMAVISILIFLSLGFKSIEIAYIALVVGFSSTMVVIKLIADKEEVNTLHGKIILGVLLVQDIIAIIALTVLTTNPSISVVVTSLLKGVLFVLVGLVLAKASTVIFKFSAKSNELMLLISLAFLFLFAMIAYSFGLSLVIGAFFAGVVLANSDFKLDIKGRIHPLRDFFGAILFVSLGIQLVWIPKEYFVLFVILTGLILVLKPLILIIIVRLFGYTNRTAFLTGNYLGQSSEFSLILLTQGLVLIQITKDLFSVLVFVTILTMSLTGYFVTYENIIYKIFLYPARIFKKVPSKKEELQYGFLKNKNKIVVIGCHRMGSLLLNKFLEKEKENMLVIDFNPDIIKSLIEKKIPCIYGDYANPEIMEKIALIRPEVIVSTIPDKEDNLMLIKRIKKISSKAVVIVVANRIHEALELYKAGADYVILPKIVSGLRVDEMIGKIIKDRKGVKKNEINFLNKIHYYLYKE